MQKRCSNAVAAVVMELAFVGVSHAGVHYTLGVTLDDNQLAPGESGRLEVWLHQEQAGVVSNSAIFRLFATEAGLLLTGYEWATPYVTNGDFDWTYPASGDWPMTLDADTLAGGGYPPGLIDIEFSNAVLSDAFASGPLLWIDFIVPLDWRGGQTVFMGAISDTIAIGPDELEVLNGEVATLHIPGPTSLVLGSVFLSLSSRRGRA